MKFLLLLFLLPLSLLAQKNEPLPDDLAGVWTGYMYNDTTQQRNDFEVAISENKRKLSGYSYTIFLIDGKKNIGVKSIKIKTRKEFLLIEDEKLIDNNYEAPPAKGVRTFIELHYSRNDTAEILAGSWKTNVTREYNSVTGNIFLERKKEAQQTAIIPKLRQLDLLDQLSFLPPSAFVRNTGAGKPSSEDVERSSDQQKIGVENEKITAGLAKKEAQQTDTEVIIPDTTIINPEITIFMFPKNDLPKKNTATGDEKNHVLATAKINPDVKKTRLDSLSGRKTEEIIKQETAVRQTVKNEADKKEARKGLTAKNKQTSETDKKQKAGSPDKTKKNETVLSVPPPTNNLPVKKSLKTEERPVVKNEDISEKNRTDESKIENVDSLKTDKNNKTTVLNQASDGRSETVQKPVSEKILAVKDKTVSGTDKSRSADSIDTDRKNKTVVLNDPANKMNIAESISKNKAAPEKTMTEIKEEGRFAKEMKTAEKIAEPKLITDEMLSARKIETIRTVEIARDTLIFSLFDNGVIDGDTVSVLLNGKVIMSKIGLLATAYNDTIYLTPEMGDSINIILYAENLGSIPPNTGLLVVREGEIDHEIRFTGDLQKNSAIILKRKKQINGK